MEGVTFGKRLKDLRSSLGMSQRELSEIIGVSKSSVNMYELDKREPGFSTLTSIADVFNVSVDYLLGHAERDPHTGAVKMYCCGVCHTVFNDADKALDCERSHKTPIKVTRARHLSKAQNGSGYPVTVTVRMSDGNDVVYKR